MKKRAIALFIASVFVFSAFPICAFADDCNYDEVGFYGSKNGQSNIYYYCWYTNK